ncbi:hypothetical protein BofuT4_uP123850.1 [Botrytis cinerea T4]|uniref:Uncharacterized protein n=1 Tax=Botryotinia fuckeliana (strain T4) TaxID=999810 RepID=G2YP18_BOTF4|nr:hypothetical protein BofuT4_uP123850.1 [Botrytis cinerea T4]
MAITINALPTKVFEMDFLAFLVSFPLSTTLVSTMAPSKYSPGDSLGDGNGYTTGT